MAKVEMPPQVKAIADAIKAQAPQDTQNHADAFEIVKANKNYGNAKNITDLPLRDIIMPGGKVERVGGGVRVDY